MIVICIPTTVASEVSFKSSSRDVTIELLEAVLNTGTPALWILPHQLDGNKLTVEQILLSLIVQAMCLNPSVLSDGDSPMLVNHFRTVESIDILFRRLQRCLKGVGQVFIVLDLIYINKLLNIDSSIDIHDFTEEIENLCQNHHGILKIVALTWNMEAIFSNEPFEHASIATDPRRKKVRLMRNPKYRAMSARKAQNISSHIESLSPDSSTDVDVGESI
jgi:hypothetical protein